MGYYRGDGGNYYRGDYYKGDPFLGGLIAKGVAKVGGRLVTGALNLARRTGAKTVGGAIARAGGAAATAGTAVSVGRQVYRGTRPGMEIDINPMDILPGGSPFISVRRKYRKLNPLNPKALKRALRRAEGFEKFAKRTMVALVKPGGGRKFKRTATRRK